MLSLSGTLRLSSNTDGFHRQGAVAQGVVADCAVQYGSQIASRGPAVSLDIVPKADVELTVVLGQRVEADIASFQRTIRRQVTHRRCHGAKR